MNSSAARLGYVASITGSQVTGVMEAITSRDQAPAAGEASAEVRIGALVKMQTPESAVYGIINGLHNAELTGSGVGKVEIGLMGEIMFDDTGVASGAFERGVSIYPALGEEIMVAGSDDLGRVYARSDKPDVRVGSFYQDTSIGAHLMTDDLMGKHFVVLGSTGSGKSCTVALLLRKVLESNQNGHIILLDPHNEYADAFGDWAEIVNTSNLYLPYWLLNFEETAEIMCTGEGADREAQMGILKDALVEARKMFQGDKVDTAYITIDTPVPYRLGELKRIIDNALGQHNRAESVGPFQRLLARMESVSNDRRYAFMFSSRIVTDNLAEVLSRLLRMPVNGKPISILDLSGVPSEVVDVVVSTMCRTIFEFSLWSAHPQSVPILLVCEEAHRYVPARDDTGFGPTKQAIARIAKEGRKYGVSLGLISQRPSELSDSIISQCGTIIAFRMGNDRDQNFVAKVLPETSQGLLSVLPALRTQEAVIVGDAITVPMRVRFEDLAPEHRPRSGNAAFSESWQHDYDYEDFMQHTIDRWRRQQR
jgi:DNA helicase HerA-like ATPase